MDLPVNDASDRIRVKDFVPNVHNELLKEKRGG
jgi:hypothetical protein